MIVFKPPVTVSHNIVPGVVINQEVEEGDGGQEAGEGAYQGDHHQCTSSPGSLPLTGCHQGQRIRFLTVSHHSLI